jgi:putative NIF3 family GTP cyclohydrolase 1 type 2
LEKFGPLNYAEKWDNVGLLIEPSTDIEVKKIILTNDLTEKVMSEAVNKNANMIISYHPPIFQGLKRITMAGWKERIVIQCMENKIALYSPHTGNFSTLYFKFYVKLKKNFSLGFSFKRNQ